MATRPDYMTEFDTHWRELVTDETGALDLDKVARELADYSLVMDEVSTVYDEISGGRFSKPNTAAHHVIDRVNEIAAETYADYLCDAIDTLGETGQPITREQLILVANAWHEGAWEQHVENRKQAAAMRASAPSVKG